MGSYRIRSSLTAWLKFAAQITWVLMLAKRRRMDYDEYAKVLVLFDGFLGSVPSPNGSYGTDETGIRTLLRKTAKDLHEKHKDKRPGWGDDIEEVRWLHKPVIWFVSRLLRSTEKKMRKVEARQEKDGELLEELKEYRDRLAVITRGRP